MRKHLGVFAALFSAPFGVGAAGCVGDTSPPPPPIPAPTVYSVSLAATTVAGLGACSAANAGQVGFVTATQSPYVCIAGKWTEIVCTVARSGHVAYVSVPPEQGLWACVEKKWTQVALPDAGPPGAESLVHMTPEPAGANCAAGGERIDVGIDLNGDGILEPNEIKQTAYVCNGLTPNGDGGACNPSLTVPNMPAVRANHVASRGPDGRLYVIGGVDNTARTTEVDAYDPCANTWSTVAPIPTPRYSPAAALGPDGRIYVMGGEGSSFPPIATVEAFDVTKNQWSTMAPMPTPRGDLGAAVGSDGRIYAVGGGSNGGGGAATNVVEAYDVTSNTWTAVAALSTARGFAAVVADSKGIVYAIGGGTDVSCVATASVEAYDPTTNMWTARAPLPTPQAIQSAALGRDGRIYTFGGEVGGNSCQSGSAANTFIYDPTTNIWTSGADMPNAVRGAAAAAGAGSTALLYVFGGTFNGPAFATVQAYDPVKNLW
jgi:N-acetylneuraminic acid mutarotase